MYITANESWLPLLSFTMAAVRYHHRVFWDSVDNCQSAWRWAKSWSKDGGPTNGWSGGKIRQTVSYVITTVLLIRSHQSPAKYFITKFTTYAGTVTQVHAESWRSWFLWIKDFILLRGWTFQAHIRYYYATSSFVATRGSLWICFILVKIGYYWMVRITLTLGHV